MFVLWREVVLVKRAWLIGLAVTISASCSPPEPTVADRALADVEALAAPRTFAFRYQAGGTAVLDCVMINRTFQVSVDLEGRHLDVTTPDGLPIAHRDQDGVLLASRLFEGTAGAEWYPVGPEDSELVAAVVGSDASGYLLPSGLPAGPREYATSLLRDASDVATLDGGQGWSLTFEESDDPVLQRLTATITLSEGAVDQIVASGQTSGGEPAGFVATYGQRPRFDDRAEMEIGPDLGAALRPRPGDAGCAL